MTNEETIKIIEKEKMCASTLFNSECIGIPCECCKLNVNTMEEIEAFTIALSSMQKQIPKKPELVAKNEFWECPVCREMFDIDCQRFEFCPNCGQAIDWSEMKE